MRVLLSDDVPAAQFDVAVVVGLDEGVHWTHDAGLKIRLTFTYFGFCYLL